VLECDGEGTLWTELLIPSKKSPKSWHCGCNIYHHLLQKNNRCNQGAAEKTMGKFRSILLLCLGFLLVHVRGKRPLPWLISRARLLKIKKKTLNPNPEKKMFIYFKMLAGVNFCCYCFVRSIQECLDKYFCSF